MEARCVVALILIVYLTFPKTIDNTIKNCEKNKLWTLGMFIDMQNKKNMEKQGENNV